MGFSCGLVGFSNTGKTTIYNALTKMKGEVSGHLYSTTKPQIAAVAVPEPRLAALASLFKPKSVVSTTATFVDIAGLAPSENGEGMGNKFLDQIRKVDALVHVLRCFNNEDVAYVYDQIDPVRDMGDLNLELILSDLEIVDKTLEKVERLARLGEKDKLDRLLLLKKIKDTLEKEKSVRTLDITEQDRKKIGDLNLLTLKPVLYLANIDENNSQAELVEKAKAKAKEEGSEFLVIKGKLEAELAEIPEEEQETFMAELGLEERILPAFIQAGYRLLGLITFLTAGEKEVRAWELKEGSTTLQAAGKVHSDIARGFIRAEVTPWAELVDLGNSPLGKERGISRLENLAREKGITRLEGKEYIVKDGDVIYFRFNI